MAANINIKQFILKRGNATVSSAYVGNMGEITYDTTLKSIRVYDGVIPGGNIILDTGFLANLQSQIDYMRQNFDPATIDSLTEAATAITSIRANAVIEANVRASSDASLQANITTVYANLNARDANLQSNITTVYANLQSQINQLVADKGNIRVVPNNGQVFNIQLDPVAGNLILPYIDFSAVPAAVGSALMWETSLGSMSIGPANVAGVGTGLVFRNGNYNFVLDQAGTLDVNDLKIGNVRINANGVTVTADSGLSYSLSRSGNILLADNSRIGTKDSPGLNTDTSSFTVRSGATTTGNTGAVTVASADTANGNSGAVTIKTGSTTNGAGGTLRLIAGSTTLGDGGDVHINTGNSVTDVPGNGGDLLITLGTAVTGDGGELRLTAGSTSTGQGGAVAITAGSTNLGDAGGFSFTAGSTGSGRAGGFLLAAGSTGTGSSGNIRVLSGDASGTAQAGNVLIRAGTNSTNSLYHGSIVLQTAGGTWNLGSDGSSSIPGSINVPGSLNVIGSATVNNNLAVLGNLTVNGTVTTLSSTTITISDKNLELAKVTSPDELSADGAGFTILGTTNKTFTWTNATGAFNSSETLNLAVNKTYKIAGNDVLTATTLGSGVVNSSLTSVGTLTAGTWQGSVIAPAYGGTGINNGTKTITLGGSFSTTGPHNLALALTGNTSLTLPTSGVLATLSGAEILSNKSLTTPEITSPVILGHATIEGVTLTGTTGTGQLVFSSSPTLVTPTLGVAAATSINKVVITAPANSAILTIADNKSLVVNNSLTFTASDASTVNFGTGGNIVYSSSKLSVFAPTTSAEFATVLADKTGTGTLVYNTSPTLVTPALGVATATSINKINITAPTNGATLTITDGKTLAVVNTLTFTGTDSSSVAFGTGGTVAYTGPSGTKLSAFATTTSNELSSVIGDETGTGSLVFNTGPTIINANLVNPSSISAAGNLSVDNNFVANIGTITTLLTTWEQIDITAGSATDVLYLTANSPRYIYLTTNNNTRNVRFPSTTTLLRGTTFVIRNSGNAGFPLQTNAGTSLGFSIYQNQTVRATVVNTAADGTSSWALDITGSSFTGAGSMVMSLSPTLITPVLGVATATSINKLTITTPATSATLTIADGKTLSVSNSLTFTGTDASSVAFGTGGTVVYTSNKLSVHAATSSSELAGIISDETGSGSLVFGTSPTITTSLVAGSSSFALLNDTATTINFGGAATTLNVGGNNVNVNFGSSTGQITAANVTATNFIGTVSNPSLPAFRVYGSTSSAIASGTTVATAQGTIVDYNQGSYYNNTTGFFTAPRAGLYHCYATLRVATNNGMNQASIQKNSSNSGANVVAFWETDTNTGTATHFSMTGYAKLAAGDTIRLYVVTGSVTFDANDSWGVTYIG